ncbi:hypothetical protein N7462_011540 [Penicillium macrosclerotiorum]|uniref:uncharacterized protein n=1 Tax=Penicillium macrosclerotiorum TaxID=303699 RepID=UPI0025488C9F|nr:uncharacterized protein N7462_011540 [Penicillium macrosclerotiorum]KAJ5664727.1 hypothetical protein N7462_011540 [Penicillium macrosclerotiorum]
MADVQVGDLVNVPGGMYGTVKYLGTVAGKPGRFAGIELGAEHAQRGKNSGDVEGRQYFATSVPGSGIFVPMNNSKYVTLRVPSASTFAVPTTPARAPPVNFSKSMGPSPSMPRPRIRRPSLPRPESPRTTVSPPKLSLGGLRTPSAASRTSASNGFQRSPIKSPVKAPSRLSDRPPSRISLDDDNASTYGRPSDFQRPSSAETQELKDHIKNPGRLSKTLEELEGSDSLNIRAQLRERNERINQLTAEFDGHRADFRSTLDTLEIAASETERVYEQRLDELLQQNKELQDRGEDVEIVAQQLKQLEELVSELEEGLEDARRGEAEARAEVEFLRGEVERTKLELQKERDHGAAALKGAQAAAESPRNSHELEQKDDEIRGLKAIIHSLSRGNPSAANLGEHSHAEVHNDQKEQVSQLEQRLQEVEGTAQRKDTRIEELERELQEFRMNSNSGSRNRSSTITLSPKQHKPTNSSSNISVNHNINHAHRLSDRTVVPNDWNDPPVNGPPQHHRGTSSSSQPRLEPMPESERSSDDDTLWCEICETGGHDILNCTSMFGSDKKNAPQEKTPDASTEKHDILADEQRVPTPVGSESHTGSLPSQKTGRDVVLEGLKGIGGLGSSMDPIAGKSSGIIDESKWCALCERDGHESIDCPFDE